MTFKPKQSNTIAEQIEQLNQQQQFSLLQQNKNKETKEQPKFSNPADVKERLRIIFDDSGSMSGQKIQDARDGCVEFLRNCTFNETACAIHILNPEYNKNDLTSLTTNLPALSILIDTIKESGGTPLGAILQKAQNSAPKATRYIVFSDGGPTDKYQELKESIINKALEEKTPIDTVLIWDINTNYSLNKTPVEEYHEYKLLKELADRTNGYFLLFDRNKVNFKEAFKYLAPNLRGKLSDGKVRLALQAGHLK